MLSTLNVTSLKKLAKNLKIKGYSKYKKSNKEELERLITLNSHVDDINNILNNVEPKILYDTGDWVKLSQIGKTGKDGKIYLVVNEEGVSMAMKIFRKNKNRDDIQKEVNFQIKAADSKYKLSPKVVEYNIDKRYIVMEKLDNTLVDIIEHQSGLLSISQQKEIIKLYSRLDLLNIFHNDANPLNIMTKDGTWYMIDYGFSCTCNHKDIKGIKYPNVQFMTVGLITWLLGKGYKVSNYEYLMKFVSKRVRDKLNNSL